MSFLPPATLTLKQDFTNALNIAALKKILPVDEETHTLEKQWRKTSIAVSFIFAGLAAFAYTKALPYTAAALGILALVRALKSRVEVKVPTPKYAELCKHFGRVIPEIRQTWRVASGLIAGTINHRQYTLVDIADRETSNLLKEYKANTLTDVPFATVEKNPMRGQFQELYPIAEKFVTENSITTLRQEPELHPAIFEKLAELYVESERLVHGSSLKDLAYVENTLSDNNTVVSQARPALLKV